MALLLVYSLLCSRIVTDNQFIEHFPKQLQDMNFRLNKQSLQYYEYFLSFD